MFDSKAYNRKYYQEHKKEIEAKNRKYYQEHKTETHTRGRKWREKNLEKVVAAQKKWRRENPDYHKEYRGKYKEELKAKQIKRERELREKALKLLGGECSVCGSKNDLECHNRKRKKHPTGVSEYLLILKNPKEWAVLCKSHHELVHVIMRKYGFTFERILFYRELLFG